jgi:uncharacterized protein YggU (UPF0235/DUF167 family)
MKNQIIEVLTKAGARERSVSQNPDGSLTVKTTFSPEKGKANQDVLNLVADYLKISKSRIELISGHTFYRKRLKIT